MQATSLALAQGAHVHSVSSGSLAVDQEQFELRLQIPGANLVGFEHPPNNEAQSATLDQAQRTLNAAKWLSFDPAGRCRLSAVEVLASGFSADADRSEHAEFAIQINAECASIDRLGWVELDLFDGWPDNRQLRMDVLTDRIQQRLELNADNVRIELD